MSLRKIVKYIKHDVKFTPLWNAMSLPLDWALRTRYCLIEHTSKVQVVKLQHNCSTEKKGQKLANKPVANKPVIYINWHTHLPFLIHYIGRENMCMLVSNAPYMNPIVRWCTSSGLQVLRGASGEGSGFKAKLQAVLEGGTSIILAVDGPAGPIFKAKRGCVDLAMATGCPIVHVHYTCKRGAEDLSRWDRMLDPALFDEICVTYAPPLYLSDDMTVDDCTQLIEDNYFKLIEKSDKLAFR
jgi:lysophospholipid acyltransferase (LPLAT)-like uncharacterized protein